MGEQQQSTVSRKEMARKRILGVERTITLNPMVKVGYQNVKLKSNEKMKEEKRIMLMKKKLAKQESKKPKKKITKSKAESTATTDLWGTKFRKLRSKPTVSKRNEALKSKVARKAPAVLLPNDGLSVNPKFEDYTAIAAAVAQKYEDDEEEKLTHEANLRRHANSTKNFVFREQAETMLDQLDDNNNDNNDDISEELSEETKKVIAKAKKSK